jgi:hypothetical protein
MKHFILLFFLFHLISTTAQTKSYTIDNQSYELKTEVEGPISLLWNIIDKEYRYFAKKGDVIVALTNTKIQGKFQEEYKAQLVKLTSVVNMDKERIDRIRLTLSNLRRFFNDYNKKVDPEYIAKKLQSDLEYRLGFFGGITNSVFRTDLSNSLEYKKIIRSQFIIDFELYDRVALPSHGVALQYRHTFFRGDLGKNDHQFSVNHRFKFIKTPMFQVYLNTKIVTYSIFRRDFLGPGFTDPSLITVTNLQSPFIFGFGTDIKLKRGYLSLNYNDAYSFLIDSRDDFPVDISAGYRFVF